jgi:methionyl-tRNA synthetase
MWLKKLMATNVKNGSTLNATDLINPKSTITGDSCYEIDETLVLPLDRYEDFLKEWILGHKMTGNPMFTDK